MSFLDVSLEYLKRLEVEVEVIPHAVAISAHDAAEKVGVSLDQVIVSVLLADENGPMLVVMPASLGLDFDVLNQRLMRRLSLRNSLQHRDKLRSFSPAFLPPLHLLFRTPAVVEESLFSAELLYLSSGSDDALLKITQAGFARLMGTATRAKFGRQLVGDGFRVREKCVKEPPSGEQRNSAVARLSLPTIPAVAKALLRFRADESDDILVLADIIESDPIVTAQVLRYAASPYFGYGGQLSSVKEAALHVLGLPMTLDIALGAAMGKAFSGPKQGPLGLPSVWKHAVYSAALSQRLAEQCSSSLKLNKGTAYLSGLLHNIGLLVIAASCPAEYNLLNRLRVQRPDSSVLECEKLTLPYTHLSAGGRLAEEWNLPSDVKASIRYHHTEDWQATQGVYPLLVLLANRALGVYGIGDEAQIELPPQALLKLGLDEIRVKKAVEEVLFAAPSLDKMVAQLAA